MKKTLLLLIGLLTLSCGDDGSPVVVPNPDSGNIETTEVTPETDSAVSPEASVEAGSVEAGIPDAAPEAGPDLVDPPDVGAPDATPVVVPDSATSPETSSVKPETLIEASVVDSGQDAAPTCEIPEILGSECNLDTSCGCAETTVCRVANIQTGQTLCFPVGEVADYSICESNVDCASESICELGICRPKCSNVNDFCADGSWCGPLTEGGASVCQGHCNVLSQVTNEYGTDIFWIDLMEKQLERGMITQAWTQPYVPCGDSAYCHPGLAESNTPYAYCVQGFYGSEEGSPCGANRDCANGLGCYDNYCRLIGFTDNNCSEDTNIVYVDGWIAPDGYNKLGVCVAEE